MIKRISSNVLMMAIGIFVLSWSACATQPSSTSDNNSTAKVGAATPPSDKGDRVVTGGDLAFMNEAAPGGMAEVELGRLATKQAASKEVKQFAERMITDHSKAGEELKQLAQQKKVILAGRDAEA